jgi:hypothetical protein
MAADMTPTTTLTEANSVLALLQPAANTDQTGSDSSASFVLDSLPTTAARFLGQVLGIALRSRVIGQWRFHQSVWDTLVGSELVEPDCLAAHEVRQHLYIDVSFNYVICMQLPSLCGC